MQVLQDQKDPMELQETKDQLEIEEETIEVLKGSKEMLEHLVQMVLMAMDLKVRLSVNILPENSTTDTVGFTDLTFLLFHQIKQQNVILVKP